MVQAGIFERTAVELPIAERWAKVMPRLRVDKHLVLARDGEMKWFVRPDAPMLRASIDRQRAELRSQRARVAGVDADAERDLQQRDRELQLRKRALEARAAA